MCCVCNWQCEFFYYLKINKIGGGQNCLNGNIIYLDIHVLGQDIL